MLKRSGSGWILGALALVAAPAGCAALLGLDQFSESAATTGSGTSTGTGGGGAGGEATSTGSSAVTTATSSGSGGAGGSVPTGPWSKAVTGTVAPKGIAADSKGNVYVTGSFTDGVQFESTAALPSAGSEDIFLVKFDSAGTALWANRYGKAQSDSANAVAIDSTDNVIIAGVIGSAVDFGGVPLQRGAFVAKFDSNGKHIWSASAQNTAAADSNTAFGVAVDPKGDVILVGEFKGSVDFGPGPMTALGTSDMMVVKLAAGDGKAIWSNAFGGAGDDRGLGIAVDTVGNLIIIGATGNGGYALGGELLDFSGGPGTFVTKMSEGGIPVWGHPVLNGTGSSVKAVATDGLGSAYVAGSFLGNNSYNFSDIISQNNSEDAFVRV